VVLWRATYVVRKATSASRTKRPPTICLADVEQRLGLPDLLVDSGGSVMVVEHHKSVIQMLTEEDEVQSRDHQRGELRRLR
jgi:hypothetical protein